eukprot:COSAG02_NODE_43_length_45989_cov_93.430181_44_plen_123_part_00
MKRSAVIMCMGALAAATTIAIAALQQLYVHQLGESGVPNGLHESRHELVASRSSVGSLTAAAAADDDDDDAPPSISPAAVVPPTPPAPVPVFARKSATSGPSSILTVPVLSPALSPSPVLDH